MTKTLSILGSTGSIGTQALEVLRAAPGRFELLGLSARSSVELLLAQAEEFRPRAVAVLEPGAAKELAARLPGGTELLVGEAGLVALAEQSDIVLNGVVGFAGLPVSLAALSAGKRLCLANKESLIAGGPVVQRARQTEGAELIPVDSEHCAIFQCLKTGTSPRRLVLTASGGPFRNKTLAELADVEVKQALSHPTWQMGPKITVDSSTLMNKGLEVIEAHELFFIDYDAIEVVVHPQSIIHSMVEWHDGATIAQLSVPDMRLPIGYALCYPERCETAFGPIDWNTLRRLDFEEPDRETFTCLSLAYQAGRQGGSAPAWLNAANEVAVAAFLDGRLSWPGIAEVIAATLERHDGAALTNAGDVLDADANARHVAGAVLERREHAA